MQITRIIRIVFGTLAGLMLLGAFADILISGHLTIISPASFGALIAVSLAVVLRAILVARAHGEALGRQTAQLKQFAARLEASLKNAATINQRLNQSEARYKGLVDAQGDAIFRRDASSRLTYGNEAFFQLFGLEPARAIGYPFAAEPHPESRAPLFGIFAALEAGQGRMRYDQHVRTVDGYRWIAWEDYAVRDMYGRLVEVQSVGRDITERKALEQALTEARDSAEAGSKAKSGFLATMSHEIRTPMNGVLGMGRLLHETNLSAEQRTYVQAITESGEALLALIGDILDFSKIESGMLTLEENEVDIRQLLANIVELLSPRANAKGIELACVIDAEIPRQIRADALRLRQVITNLVGNAVKFTERGGICVSLRLVMSEGRHFLRFDVRDTGVGVPAAKRQEIFEEFVQADSSHARKFGGTGLGLAISKRLVENWGGQIGVDEAADLLTKAPCGSCFWFTLPSMVVEAAPAEARPLAGLRIAVMSRNAVLAESLARQILVCGGTFADPTRNEEEPADAILIDGGSGAEPEPVVYPHPGIPAILLVTPPARSRVDAFLERDFAGYLLKPMRQTSLVERVIEVTGGPKLSAADIAAEDPHSDVPPLIQQPARESAPTSTPASTPVPASRPAPDSAPATQQGLSILLAEDNPINMMLIRELLRRRGHHVQEVTTGTDAVKAVAERHFDLLLTDIHMPGMDGIEAARAIREQEAASERARVPIVALTADALETGKRACQDAGMDGFLTKPVDPAELEEMFLMLFPSEDCPTIAA